MSSRWPFRGLTAGREDGPVAGVLKVPEVPPARLFAVASLVAVPPVVTSAARISQLAGALSAWESTFVTICHVVYPLHLVPALLFTATFPELPRLGT